MQARPVLVTGAAGFIGMHVCERLATRGDTVVGVDCLGAGDGLALKRARLAELRRHATFSFRTLDLADPDGTAALFRDVGPDRVVHLAAQAGVRASTEDPIGCVRSNCDGFVTVLEGARRQGVGHLVFASSSSVYGANRTLPYAEGQPVDHPVSLYAATKKANELMAHAFAHVHRLPVTGLRFFTVYGPWGRPDMAVFLFTRAIVEGRPIRLFNQGAMRRDFTYVDDIARGVVAALDRSATPDPHWDPEAPATARSAAPYRIYNIGNSQSVSLPDFVATLERIIGKPAVVDLRPMQPGDVLDTCADVTAFAREIGLAPRTPLVEGLTRFVAWYRDYHGFHAAEA